MGKNKPAPRNSFYYFMLDFKQKQPRRFENMAAVAEAAGPHWENMTPEQKKPYEEKAKLDKNNQKVAKYTSTGVKIDVMQRRENERAAKEQRMKDDIENTIQKAVEGGHIAEQMFYLIHVNHFCYCNSNSQYIPAELAVARFTLKDGVSPEGVYHAIVKPGPLPLGYSYQAQKTSEDTHQIKAPLSDELENNLDKVTEGLLRFMTEHNANNHKIPPVFCQAKNKDVVESVLKSFCINFGHEEDAFKVYSMEYLFFVLRNAVNNGSTQVYPTITLSTLELEKDKYDFCKDIPCSYHEISDVPNHCSRSHVIRLAYIICDNCCGDLGIDLVPGLHVPREANVYNIRPSSSASGYASSVSSAATVKEQRRPYFLSQHTECGLSGMSETSSICDANELGGYAYDTESTQADPEDWIQPKQRHKRTEPARNLQSSEPTSELHFTYASGSSVTGDSQPTVSRRPAKPSAALSGGLPQLSLSQLSLQSDGSFKTALPVGRGRGRGIAANFSNKMT